MHTHLVAWCLAILNLLVPAAPWSSEFPREAEAFVTAAERDPLFKDKRGVEETVDYELSVAFFESTFNPAAIGDKGGSWGLFQVSPPTAAPYAEQARAKRIAFGDLVDLWRPVGQDLLEPEAAAPLAIKLMKISFQICRDRPREERLGWYAAGGTGCRGIKESRHRVGKAQWLAQAHPFVSESEEKVAAR
jgi:hypothetical protein